MSVKIWAKVSLLFLSVSVLSGCNILTDLFHQDKKQGTRVVAEEQLWLPRSVVLSLQLENPSYVNQSQRSLSFWISWVKSEVGKFK